jgi:hypothetical protein
MFSIQEKLKYELQAEQRSSKLEHLAAALLSRLLAVPISVSKSGFQHGGDAGPAGRQGRRFRLECKKYSDSTSLSDRELLGELDHALARDPALEGWFLIATRNVPEQLVQDLVQKGERIGVPIVIIDWKDHDLAPLAALCAFAPDLVESMYSPAAGALASALEPAATDAITSLRGQLQSWCLGFATLRVQSHAKLNAIWNEPRTSALARWLPPVVSAGFASSHDGLSSILGKGVHTITRSGPRRFRESAGDAQGCQDVGLLLHASRIHGRLPFRPRTSPRNGGTWAFD